MPETRAALFVRPGIERDRQWAMCLEYADRHGYRVVSVIHSSDDAVALARAAAAGVIVAAFAERRGGSDTRLRTQLVELGCRLEYVRPPRQSGQAAAGRLIAGMYVRGGSVQMLAQLLDVDPAAVRQELMASGIDLRPEDRPAS